MATPNLPASIGVHRHSIAEIAKSIQQAVELAELTEARARVEAIRAWARVHGQAQHLRADLLTIEVEALVRIVQLGGKKILNGADWKAAVWLADMTVEQRAGLIEKSVKATTAVGMCRAVWRETEITRKRGELRKRGVYLTDNPEPPAELDDSAFEQDARRHRRKINDVLNEIAENYTGQGVSLTPREMADRILADAGFAGTEDPDVLAGVTEVCDRVIKATPTPVIDGTEIPRIITAHNGNRFTRIPVMNATLAHLRDMIAIRQAQIAADQDEVSSLCRVADKLATVAGGDEDTRIGVLIGRTLKTGQTV